VYAAFAIALIIGAATFLIWWITSDVRRFGWGGRPPEPAPAASPSTADAKIETALPRGGTLRGSTDTMALSAERLTTATLVRVNRSSDELEPWLAESWIEDPGHLIYMVKLRPGLLSAAGAPLTSADVVLALASLSANGQPVGVRAIDPLTVEITFNAPFAPGLRLLDLYPIAGFGPYVEGAAKSGIRTFRRNPNYWRKAPDGSALPYVDEIVLSEARLKSSPAGTSSPASEDFAEAPVRAEDVEAIKKLEQDGKLRLYELGPGLDGEALWIAAAPPNAGERPWLTSDAFRLAISTAVDRREYCKQVFYGACDPMSGPVSPVNLRWFNPDFPLGGGDPKLARAMLEEQGLRDRNGDGLLDDAMRKALRFTVLIRRDVSSSARAAQFLAATLKTIGVQMDVTPLDEAAFAARRQKGNYDAMYDRIEVRDTDPAMNLDFWLSSGARHVWHDATPFDSAQGRRIADWERQIDQLMLKNAGTFNRADRLQAFVDAQKIYLQHMPAIFFGTPRVRIATGMRTLNATPSPLRPHLLWNAENLAALK
jgi:peptide/nickel transport system substrate-binding protein